MVFALAAMAAACASANAQTSGQERTARQDTEFLNAANQGSVDEINMAQIAADKAQDPQVKEFAQKMMHDHQQLLDDMKRFDEEAGVKVPDHSSASTMAEEAKLKVLSGKSFDKAYVKEMVEAHHKDLEAFMKEEKTTGYPAFKEAVGSGEKVVREHLEMIDRIAKQNGVAPAPVPGE